MILDPELAEVLAPLMPAAHGAPATRSALADMDLIRMLRSAGVTAALGAEISTDDRVDTYDRTVPGPGADPDVGVRIYTPVDLDEPLPVIVYFHGGAFILGDTTTEEVRCLALAADARCVVVSVDYRLAPEHPFPAGVEDCYAALQWVYEHGAELGADATRLAVAGSSAGGALAAAVALMARDRHGPALSFQMLVYPVIDDRMTTVSMRTGHATPLLNNADAAVMWRYYLGEGHGEVSPYAAPARATDLSGLPGAYILVAEHDPLRDEGIEYATRLLHAGVSTELHCVPAACHGFDLIGTGTAIALRALDEQVASMRRALWSSLPGPAPGESRS